MNLNCANCEEILSSYLSDLPVTWRGEIIRAICNVKEIDCAGCDDCETLTSLSTFKRVGNTVSITYKDEKLVSHTRQFVFDDILNSSLIDVDPKCIMDKGAWDLLSHSEKMQAILDYDCGCCTTTTSSTTTSTSNPCIKDFTIINFSEEDIPFEIIFKDTQGNTYIVDTTTVKGDRSYYRYTSTQNLASISIKHTPAVSGTVSVQVNGEEFALFTQDISNILLTDVPACSDIVVSILTGIVTTTTTSTRPPTTTTSTSTSTSTTVTTTERPRTPTTTTSTTANPCKNITNVVISNTSSVTTSTTVPPVPCGTDLQYSGGQSFPTIVEITLGTGTGEVTFDYNAFDIPDKFVLVYDGVEVINTGYRGDPARQASLDAALAAYGLPPEPIIGNNSGSQYFIKTTPSTHATLYVWAPLNNTGWEAFVSCPGGEVPTTTSTTTTTTKICPDVEDIIWIASM